MQQPSNIIYLASKSPRRRELLKQIGVQYELLLMREVAPRYMSGMADFDWPEPDARREFLRVKLNSNGALDLYPTQDSAVMTSTSWADGLVDNPAGQAIRVGDQVRYLPYSELFR